MITTQNVSLDELREQLGSTDDPAERIVLMHRIGVALGLRDNPAAIAMLNEAVTLARAIGDRRPLAALQADLGDHYHRAGRNDEAYRMLRSALHAIDLLGIVRKVAVYINLAGICKEQGRYADAMDWGEKALVLGRAEGTSDCVGAALTFLGEMYEAAGDFPKALEAHQEALEIWHREESTQGLAVGYTNIATVYCALGEWETALDFFQRALPLYRKMEHRRGEASSYFNIGGVYVKTSRYELALKYLLRARELYRKYNYRDNEAVTSSCIGGVYMEQGDVERALEGFQYALTALKDTRRPAARINPLAGMGNVHKSRGEYQAAFACFEEAAALARAFHRRAEELDIYKGMAKIYQTIGEPAKALHYYTMFMDMKMESHDREAKKAAEVVRMRIEMARAEKERELYRAKSRQLEAEMEHKRRELMSLALHLTQKNEFVANLRKQIDALQGSSGTAATLLPAIDANLHADGWELFEQQFQQVHPGFVQIISTRWPALTPMELKVCALMKTDLTTKQIAGLLCTSQRTVEGHRRYIRRKLGLGRQENLYTFLAALR